MALYCEEHMSGETRTIRVEIEKAVFGGLFLGRHEGKAVLVPHAVPGETVTVRILSEKKDYCTGEIESITAGSGDRILPACPLYARCGGCSYLHVPYEKELEYKKDVLMDSLDRIAGMDRNSPPGQTLSMMIVFTTGAMRRSSPGTAYPDFSGEARMSWSRSQGPAASCLTMPLMTGYGL